MKSFALVMKMFLRFFSAALFGRQLAGLGARFDDAGVKINFTFLYTLSERRQRLVFSPRKLCSNNNGGN
jgi:hypothetical protein